MATDEERRIRNCYRWLRSRARRRGVLFELSLDEQASLRNIEACSCCGMGLMFAAATEERTNTWTLDRVDPRIGYKINNVWVACMACNTMKYTWHNPEVFMWHATQIYENWKART